MTKNPEPGLIWRSYNHVPKTDVEAFILRHDGHDVCLKATVPSGKNSTPAQFITFSMYCPVCSEKERRRAELSPVIDLAAADVL